jgi:Zn-dependent M28 family amino/carboxypeptidase
MKFKLKLFPKGRREWLRMIVPLGLFILLFAAAAIHVTSMPGRSHVGQLQPLSDEEAGLRDRLTADVAMLAGKIGQRNIEHYESLKAAAAHIRASLESFGYKVEYQEFTVEGKTVANIEVEIAGTEQPREIVIVGAHYDSVNGSPGANDNATGVAALIELARLFRTQSPGRTLRFVAFVNEEPPYFQTGNMGSRVYSRRCRERGENVTAMLSLETIGYYLDEDKSQLYPFPFRLFYPGKGDFIGFVGNTSSRPLVRRVVNCFRQNAAFPSEGIAAPGWLTGIGWSDQWSFWKEGYPGVMITDTAIFRYKRYHTLSDTPDKIDYERMARVVNGVRHVVVELVSPQFVH